MFLSLVRPDRILSPITRRAATSLGAGALAVVIIAWRYATEDGQSRNSFVVRPYPAIVGYAASSHPLRHCVSYPLGWSALPFRSALPQSSDAGGARRHSRSCRVEMRRGGCRLNISVAASFVWRCLSGSPMIPEPFTDGPFRCCGFAPGQLRGIQCPALAWLLPPA